MRVGKMPLSVRVYGDEQPGRPGAEPIATLVLDAPRILVGRAEGSEVRLPEPSVSARHLSIRQKGNDYVLIDEGSTNGTRVGKTTLVAHAPQTMRPAEVVRVGRLWLELAVVSEPPTRGAPQVAKEIALALVTRGLSDAGEDGRPKVRVVEGPDAGTEAVIEPGAALVLGRAKDAGLPLADPEASRRHAEVKLRGDQILVRDLGSRTGTTLGDRALGGADVPWKVGERLKIAGTVLECSFEAVQALAELERQPDCKVSSRELQAREEPTSTVEVSDDELDGDEVESAVAEEPAGGEPEVPTAELAPREDDRPRARSREGRSGAVWSITDFAVVVLALGVVSLSAVGYWVLLR
ncbi:MAG: FHA domain-containing protein [Polyangiaceae bacterium]|jgi:pSer/pThr/pTyr-binding forkhead associated (FHA) protein|nr:FHA domain-containing protein [Polyangiaceae bacterium]